MEPSQSGGHVLRAHVDPSSARAVSDLDNEALEWMLAKGRSEWFDTDLGDEQVRTMLVRSVREGAIVTVMVPEARSDLLEALEEDWGTDVLEVHVQLQGMFVKPQEFGLAWILKGVNPCHEDSPEVDRGDIEAMWEADVAAFEAASKARIDGELGAQDEVRALFEEAKKQASDEDWGAQLESLGGKLRALGSKHQRVAQ